MTETSDKLAHDLRDIDRLIAALRTPLGVDDEDIESLRWLQARRRSLSSLLAVRRRQRGKKVVSLELWRHGSAPKAAKSRGAPATRRLDPADLDQCGGALDCHYGIQADGSVP